MNNPFIELAFYGFLIFMAGMLFSCGWQVAS